MQKNKAKTNSNAKLIFTVITLAIIFAGTYFYISNQQTPLPVIEPMPVPIPAIEEAQPVAPEIVKPLPPAELPVEPEQIIDPDSEVETANPLPSLNDSDAMVFASTEQLSPLPNYTNLLTTTNIIRNFVVFIDNLSRGELLTKYSPLTKPIEPFSVVKIDNEIYLNEESYHRYDLYVDIINSIDIDFAIDQYRTLKPLFNEAYQELGYAENEFDATLYDAIEMVLNAPIVREPIKLVAPSAMYKFAEAELEALPSADKLMIRMGPDNILKLRVKLQEFQIALEGLSKQ
ncbi:MAG: hypothetical protein ACJAT7_000851 [Psychromonas sp.]|jgi:hypothetical protein|uniref:DUF3014 domain-containing protein n=1 Tax=Psychromonas sp. TaxID=1884585 RepID=UPI0039E2EC14